MADNGSAFFQVTRLSRTGRFLYALMVGGFALLWLFSGRANTTNDVLTKAAHRAELLYRQTRELHTNTPDNVEIAWHFSKACFDHAEFAQNDEDRNRVGEEGVAAARKAIELDSTNGAAHYYLAMNLGQVARTKTVGALKLVKEMEKEFELALQYNENWDMGGPDRSLGLLYLDAPGWPISVGNRLKAQAHLLHAVELGPDFPENHLCLMEAYIKWEDFSKIQPQLDKLKEIWPEALKRYTGDEYASSWVDWEKRQNTIREKMKEKRQFHR